MKKASRRAVSVFTVENPHNIDCHARTLFPMAFLVVNILYWLYYLFLWAFSLKLLPCCFRHPDASLSPHLRPKPGATAWTQTCIYQQTGLHSSTWAASLVCTELPSLTIRHLFSYLALIHLQCNIVGKQEKKIHDCWWIYFDLMLILYKINLKKSSVCESNTFIIPISRREQ